MSRCGWSGSRRAKPPPARSARAASTRGKQPLSSLRTQRRQRNLLRLLSVRLGLCAELARESPQILDAAGADQAGKFFWGDQRRGIKRGFATFAAPPG